MRLKILSLFLVIQFISFGIWNATSEANTSANLLETIGISSVSKISSQVSERGEETLFKAPATEEDLKSLKFGEKNMNESSKYVNSIKQNQIKQALSKLPKKHAQSIETIMLDYNPQANRGLGGGGLIILRGVNMSTQEFIGVLIHETAHNVDYSVLSPIETKRESSFYDGKTPLYETDPSLDFYRMTWLSTDKMRTSANNMDFVSGYAMSEPHEDFAESYAYYVLHNKDFKVMAAESEALLAKYNFIKYRLFKGYEFDTGDGVIETNQRPWDTTVLNYSLIDFLG